MSQTQTTEKPMNKAQLMEQNAELQKKLDQANAAVEHSRNAIHAPVVIHKTLEPLEEQIGQDRTAIGSNETSEIVVPKADGVDDPRLDKEKLENLRFMEEPVKIYIHPTSDKLAPAMFSISVNGIEEIFRYGETKTVKRKFVEGIMRAKPVNFKNEEYTTSEGLRSVRWPTSTGLRYNFSIVEDKNPVSDAWMKATLAQVNSQ